MPTSNELYYAVLAMDAYNRQATSTDSFALAVSGTAIGNATLRAADLDNLPTNYNDFGFFATAYNLGGEIVISYRGTDFLGPGGAVWEDVLYGWVSGVGAYSPQLAAAELFYESVTGADLFGGAQSNVVLTGHSLGAGLAGYISTLSGTNAVVFDEMPYAESAVVRWAVENLANGVSSVVGLFDGSETPTISAPSASNVDAYRTVDEVLFAARALGPISVVPLAFVANPALAPAAILAEAYAAALRPQQESFNLDSNSDMGVLQLHSQALLVSLMFADENEFTDWQSIGVPLISALYDAEIADEIGFGNQQVIPGYFDSATKMQTAIAYSVIDAGTDEARPFGDTAIRAWFDDANELGRAVSETDGAVDDLLPSLTRIITQYAGELAFRDDENVSHLAGVVTLEADLSTLAIDLSAITWTFSGGLGGTAPAASSIVGREQLLEDIDTGGFLGIGGGAVGAAFDALYGANGVSSVVGLFDGSETPGGSSHAVL